MPWDNSPAKRAQDARVYGDPEYKRNRALAIHRAGGRCEHLDGGKRCNSRDRISVDHIKAVSQGGTHHLDNLRVLCRHSRGPNGERTQGSRKAARCR